MSAQPNGAPCLRTKPPSPFLQIIRATYLREIIQVLGKMTGKVKDDMGSTHPYLKLLLCTAIMLLLEAFVWDYVPLGKSVSRSAWAEW